MDNPAKHLIYPIIIDSSLAALPFRFLKLHGQDASMDEVLWAESTPHSPGPVLI
jgi:hypothetical protein